LADLARLLRFLARARFSRHVRSAVAGIVLAGLASGAASSGLIVLINAALGGHPGAGLRVWFVLLCVTFPATRFVSDVLLGYVSEHGLCELRLELSRRLLATPLVRLESLGAHRLLAILTSDINVIATALAEIPLLCRHLAVVAGCLLYMGWLSWRLLAVVIAFLLVGAAVYRLPVASSLRHFARGREQTDELFRHLRSLAEGAKDLIMDRARTWSFLDRLLAPTAQAVRRSNFRGTVIYAAGNAWGQSLFFIAIGLTLFQLGGLAGSQPSVPRGFTLAMLFLITPLDVILNVLPRLSRASVAVTQIERLGDQLAADADAAAALPSRARGLSWQRLDFQAVSFTYRNAAPDERFTLGPLDLTLRPGELLFVVGGNGSGKTTLAKLLTGLYPVDGGRILLDGAPLTAAALPAYRELWGAVFTDSYLFPALLGLDHSDLDQRARAYLETLRLSHKLKIVDGAFSTADLSFGQRKRLLLLAACLQDRPIYLFDEWASGQDFEFKEFFYLQLLPDLKARRRAVVVITHDERYFDTADRLLHLDTGRVVAATPAALGALQQTT
jgi:putative ATP-binding cassette transporter